MSGLTELLEAAVKGGVRKGFTNYHGSPHIFDRFDISKIGSGEGNQTYGWGLYTADSEGVGKAYRDQLKGKGDRFEHPQFGVVAPNKVEQYLASVARKVDPRRFGELKAKATAQAVMNSPMPAEEQLAGILEGSYPDQKGWAELTKAFAPFKRIENPGAMYEVGVAADPKVDYLYHDKMLVQQSPKVQEALKDLRLMDPVTRPASVADTGRTAYGRLSNAWGSDRRASQALLDRGVEGIRYPDQASRDIGIKTYNTIHFSDKLISIVKRYGIAALVGQGLISQQLADQLKAQGIDKGT